MHRSKTIRVTFCLLDGSNQLCPAHVAGSDTILFRNFLNFLHLHVETSSNNLEKGDPFQQTNCITEKGKELFGGREGV